MTKHVLIAEDSPDVRDILVRLFTMYDFQVSVAEDGQVALDRMRQVMPDLLILDINMPHLSGFDVLAYVRENQTSRNLKVIIVTGNTLATQDPMAEHADLIMMKPFDISELIVFVNRLVK